MIDLLQVGQDALVVALKPLEADQSLPQGLKVYQHVPTGTTPPYVVIGKLTSETQAPKGAQFELITVEIAYVYRGDKRHRMLAMMHAGRAALDGKDITLPDSGVEIDLPHWVSSEASDVLEDGATYVGISTFKFFAQPA